MSKDINNNANDNLINASEINKFVYCPHLWYFGRNVGAKTLREMAQERNARYKTTKGEDPRDKGTAYHDKHYNTNVKVTKGGGCLTLITGILIMTLMVGVVVLK